MVFFLLLISTNAWGAKRWVVSPIVAGPDGSDVPKVSLIQDTSIPCTDDGEGGQRCTYMGHMTVYAFADYALSLISAMDFSGVDADSQIVTIFDYDTSTEDATFGSLPAATRNKINTFLTNHGMATISNSTPLWQVILNVLKRKFPDWTKADMRKAWLRDVDPVKAAKEDIDRERDTWLASLDGQMLAYGSETFADDVFDEAGPTQVLLDAHTPTPTGTSWTKQEQSDAAAYGEILYATDVAAANAAVTDHRVNYTINNTGDTLETDYQSWLFCSSCVLSGTDDPALIFMRWASTTSWYACQIMNDGTAKVYEKAGAGAATLHGTASSITWTDSSQIRCEVSAAAPPVIKIYHGSTELISQPDSTGASYITAAGATGIGWGNFAVSTYDIKIWKFTRFQVTQGAAGRRRIIIIGDKDG